MKVQLPAILSKVASRKDRSYSLTFETRELGKDAAMLFDLLNNEGYLLFSPNDDLTEADVPVEKADAMTGQKSQAQRLRGVVFILWKQKGGSGSFEDYYRSVLENIIDQMKEKIEG